MARDNSQYNIKKNAFIFIHFNSRCNAFCFKAVDQLVGYFIPISRHYESVAHEVQCKKKCYIILVINL